MNILITGGAGYIGSHITTLSSVRNKVIIIDNFSNSRKNIINNFKKLNLRNIKIIKADIRDTKLLIKIIKKYNIEAVIHLAALKSVKESFKKTNIYFDNNINGSISIAKAMQETGCKKLVFSSTASVYGNPKYFPIDERHPISKKLNPYANSKYQIEKYLYNRVITLKSDGEIILDIISSNTMDNLEEDYFTHKLNHLPYFNYESLLFFTTVCFKHTDFDRAIDFDKKFNHKPYNEFFKNTFGYIVYHHQLEHFYSMITGADKEEAVLFRKNWNKKKRIISSGE